MQLIVSVISVIQVNHTTTVTHVLLINVQQQPKLLIKEQP